MDMTLTTAINELRQRIEQMPDQTPEPDASEMAIFCPQEALTCLARHGYPKRHAKRAVGQIKPVFSEQAQGAIRTALASDSILLLLGPRGAGKTQVAVQVAIERIRDGRSPGRYLKTTDMFAIIKATWTSTEREDDVLRRLRKTPLLVLDEFHEMGTTEWEQRTVVNLLDHRYDDEVPTILISNCTPENVAQTINPSVLDRANERGGILHLDGPSHRISQ
jgi:DNA replication protein DnaC